MTAKQKKYQQRLNEQECCIIIPTYNNAKTLASVIEDVLQYTSKIIVIDDGSTDSTSRILGNYQFLKLIKFESNKGKGAALKEGFKAAERLGFEYAITLDSDGQHFAEDIPKFLEALEDYQDKEPLLLIGSRNMNHHSIPGKSAFGNRCSTFWYRVETGVKLVDTQCGFRLYPIKLINQLNLYTSRFELEIEVIVKAAWKGAMVKNIPVQVHYDETKRITHYRPWQDTARIVVLNSYFVFKRTLNLFTRS